MAESKDSQIIEKNIKENKEEILQIKSVESDDSVNSKQKKRVICDFIITKKIGEGTFSNVRLAINRQTGEKVAIKIMEKSKIIHEEDKIRMYREIEILKKLRHPNIVQLYTVIENNDKIYLIMEYIKGQELFNYIVAKKKLSEKESCFFFQQLISGIEYLHKVKYVHRDIKPENLIINENSKQLVIIDFGLSNIYSNPNKELLSSACGSPSYAAPEMLNGDNYRGPPVDIWSCGIVLYAMLCGYLPFDDDNNDNDKLYDKICKGKFMIPNHVSEKARDLLNKILVTDPQKRLNLFQIKSHPWFSLYNKKGKLMMSDGLILSKYVIPVDEEIVISMSKEYNINEEIIRVSILSNKHNDISTIYYLLLNKKIQNKKKSEADIKSNLFKKYCENKNNLMKKYNNDINKVIEERKNGYLNNLENSTLLGTKEDIIWEKKRLRKKLKSFASPNEKIKIQNFSRKLNKTELKINKNLEIKFNLNKTHDFSEKENNFNKKEQIKMDINNIIQENKNIIKLIDINTHSQKLTKINKKTNNSRKESTTNSSFNNNNYEEIFNKKSLRNKLLVSEIEAKNKKLEENKNCSSKKENIHRKEKSLKTNYNNKINLYYDFEIKRRNENELSERVSCKKNLINSKFSYFLEDIPSIRKEKLEMNIIYENQELGSKSSKVKHKFISFLTNNTFKKKSNNTKILNKISTITKSHIFDKKLKNTKDINKIVKDYFSRTKKIDSLNTNRESNNSLSIQDSFINSNPQLHCFEPFDLAFTYLKPKKLLKEKLNSLLEKSKIKFRLINQSRYIIEMKKEDISLNLMFAKLKDINDDKEKEMNNTKLNLIKIKRLTGGYESNLKAFEKIVYKIT